MASIFNVAFSWSSPHSLIPQGANLFQRAAPRAASEQKREEWFLHLGSMEDESMRYLR